MSEIVEKAQETLEQAPASRLNGWIAALVALCATFMALCNVKDGNVVQAMQQAQAQAVDQWSYFQSKSTKQHIAENAAEMLKFQMETAAALKPETRVKLEAKIADLEAKARKYDQEKAAIQTEAKAQEKAYQDLNVFDDQFDMAEACLSVALAMFGITALTQKKPLFFFSLAFAALGVIFGLSGFLHGNIHPDWLAKLLG